MHTFKSPRPVEEIIQEYQEQKTEDLQIERYDDRLFMSNYFNRENIRFQECTEEDIIKTVQYFNIGSICVSEFEQVSRDAQHVEIFPESLLPLFNHFHGILELNFMTFNEQFIDSIRFLKKLEITMINGIITLDIMDLLIKSILDGKIKQLKIKGVAHNYDLFKVIEYYEELNQLNIERTIMHHCRRYIINRVE